MIYARKLLSAYRLAKPVLTIPPCAVSAAVLTNERFVNLAKEAGIIKENGLQIIDSTHVLGAAAVKDTYTLIKGAKLLKISQKQNGKAAKILEIFSFLVDYSKKDNKLVKDSRAVMEVLKKRNSVRKNRLLKICLLS